MFLKIEPPPLDLKEPWKGDAFKRRDFANILCALLKTTSHSSVIGISAPYGFGKTFFLQRLREQIKNEDGWVVYVNAWEYDYMDSALFALLNSLKVAANELTDKKVIKQALTDIGRAAAPAIAKAASKRLFESVIGTEGSKDVVDAVAEAAGKSADNLIARFVRENSTNKTLNILRDQIREFVATHIREHSNYKTLIVIVDELDRARPNFCIRFLETIKHLFFLSQVVFIIGCDRAVLVSSARHEYGADLPIDGYLRRLFDYWIDLPPLKAKEYIVQCVARLNLFKDGIFSNSGRTSDDVEGYADLLLLGRRPEDISLRFIEQSVAHAGVVLRLSGNDKQAGLIGWLQGLKQSTPDLYPLYVSNRKISEVFTGLKSHAIFIDANELLKAWIVLWACNAKEKLTTELLRKLIGEGQPLFAAIRRITSDRHLDLEERKSLAAETDRLIRSVTLRA